MTRCCVLARGLLMLALAGCVPPRPVAWYDAAADVIHYDDAGMTKVAEDWGPAGVEWIVTHEEGHRRMMQIWRQDHVAVWLDYPGPPAVEFEEFAQCWATAQLGHGAPWGDWGAEAVAAGYWECPADYLSRFAVWPAPV